MTGLELTVWGLILSIIGICITLNSRFRYKNTFTNTICNVILSILSTAVVITVLSLLELLFPGLC